MVRLVNCGITIEVNAIEAQRYLAAGYVEVEEPVEVPAPARPEAAEETTTRKIAKRGK